MITDKIYLALSLSQKNGDPLVFVRDPCEGLGRPLTLSTSQKDGEPLLFLPDECTGVSLQSGKIYLGIQHGFASGDPLIFVPCCGDEEPPCVGARVNFSVSGCRGGLNGAVCTITRDEYSASCTTATSLSLVDGYCTINMGAADIGTYNYEITHPSGRFQAATGTFALSSGSCVANVSVTLAVATGYVCTNCCNLPLPETVYLDDKFGTTELIFVPISGAWHGCNSEGPTSSYHIERIGSEPPYNCEAVLGGLGKTAVSYSLFCNLNGNGDLVFTLIPFGAGCAGGVTNPPGPIWADCDGSTGVSGAPCDKIFFNVPLQLACYPYWSGTIECSDTINISFEIPSFILGGFGEQCDGDCEDFYWSVGDTFDITE